MLYDNFLCRSLSSDKNNNRKTQGYKRNRKGIIYKATRTFVTSLKLLLRELINTEWKPKVKTCTLLFLCFHLLLIVDADVSFIRDKSFVLVKCNEIFIPFEAYFQNFYIV